MGNGGGILKKRKKSKIICYVRYNKDQDPQNYYREQLMLFYPWRKEKEDLLGESESYENQYDSKLPVITAKKKNEMDDGLADMVENNT